MVMALCSAKPHCEMTDMWGGGFQNNADLLGVLLSSVRVSTSLIRLRRALMPT